MLPRCTTEVFKHGYSQFCYNAYFENANVFQHDWYIREQCEHNMNFTFAMWDFVHRNTSEAENRTQLDWVTQEHTRRTHLKHLPASFVHCVCYKPHWPTHGVTTYCHFQTALLHHCTVAHGLQPFWYPLPQANSRTFHGNTPFVVQYLCIS